MAAVIRSAANRSEFSPRRLALPRRTSNSFRTVREAEFEDFRIVQRIRHESGLAHAYQVVKLNGSVGCG
jgi:hypothetical protein